MKLEAQKLEAYLSGFHGRTVQILSVQNLSDRSIPAAGKHAGAIPALKAFGYGRPVLIHYRFDGEERRVVLHTAPANQFGHENRADRAAELLLSYDTFNALPNHVPALDVGVFVTPYGRNAEMNMLSLAGGDEFFLLSQFVQGVPYARDLQQLRDGRRLEERDLSRARCLAAYLAQIHAVKYPDSDAPLPIQVQNGRALYQRRIRDTVGSGEGIMGLLDSYQSDFTLATPARLEQIERECIGWRWRLKGLSHRLSQVHGDFHPFNILFADNTEFVLLDRSRGQWGEPGDDVSCLAINYLFFSLQQNEFLVSPFQELWDAFWDAYLEITQDDQILAVVAPFLVWRALVLANPIWYNTSEALRCALFRFAEHVLHEDRFDPRQANHYIGAAVTTG